MTLNENDSVSFVLRETDGQQGRLDKGTWREDLVFWFADSIKDSLVAAGFNIDGPVVYPLSYAGMSCPAHEGKVGILVFPYICKDPRAWQIRTICIQSRLRRFLRRSPPLALQEDQRRILDVVKQALEDLKAGSIRW